MANLKYGDKEIDQQQFLEAAANNVQSYINSQPWTKKTKEKWINAYSDLMSKGITGASISQNGIWQIDYSAQQMDQSNMSQRDKDIYKDAAWFIKKQMESIGEVKPEEEKKSPAFTNEAFVNGFNRQISNDLFGGQKWTTQENWNVLDERGENGLRGTDKRREQLALVLEQYAKSIKEGDYDFTDSPFADYNDLQTKIGAAVTALRDPNGDYKTALNRIGINPNNYFYDGSGDVYGTDAEGNSITYGQYYGTIKPQLDAAELKQKQELETQKAEEQKKAEEELQSKLFNSVESSNPIHIAWNSKQLADQFGGDLSQATNFLIQLAQSPQKISGANWGIAKGLFKFYNQQGQLKALSDEEKQLFKNLPQYANSASRLRKIEGVDGLYYDPTLDRVIRGKNGSSNLQDVFTSSTSYNSEATQKQLIANLVGIGADIASIVDPEPFSAAGLALSGSVARSIGGTNSGFWNKVLDYGSAILGAVPVLGDSALAFKVANNLRKLNTAFGAVSLVDLVAAGTGKEAANSLKNVIDGNATLKDWENVGKALRDIVAMRGAVRNNLTERTALQQSGVKTKVEEGQIGKINERLRKLGLKRTKPADSELEITSTVRMKSDTDDDIELKLEGESGKKLTEAFKGKSNKEKLETLKKLANDDPAIKQAVADQGIDLTKIKSLDPSLRGSFFNLTPIRKITGGSNHGIVKTNEGGLKQVYRENTFQNYAEARRKMNPLRRLWQAETQGTLKAIEAMQKGYLNGLVKSTPLNNIEERDISTVANALFPTSRQLTRQTKLPQRKSKVIEQVDSSDPSKKIKTTIYEPAQVTYKSTDGTDHTIKWDPDYNFLFIDGKKGIKVSGLHEAKKIIGEKVRNWEGIASKTDIKTKLSKEQINKILDLKRKGFFLKYGGRLNNRTKIKIV